MSEQINKLQPDRTLALRGFDSLGASASIHSASPTSFTVSGSFRDPADFAVLVLYDADNFYEHPRLKYLPDFNFDGVKLEFDVLYENLMPLNCGKFWTIDWPFLDIITSTGDRLQKRLSDYATPGLGVDLPATASFELNGDGMEAFDRITLWYQNIAYDYTVPGKLRTEFQFFANGAGTVHSIAIAGRSYSYTELGGEHSEDIAIHMQAIVNGLEGGGVPDPDAHASPGSTSYAVQLERKRDDGTSFSVAASDYNLPDLLWNVRLTTVLNNLAEQVNSFDYSAAHTPFALAAGVAGSNLNLTTTAGGYDANFLRMYSVARNDRLRTTHDVAVFTGGTSNRRWHVSLDFTQLNATLIRQMWLTFAPRLADGEEYGPHDWSAAFSNWTVTGPDEALRLQVAGPGSVRIPSTDPRCKLAGAWVPQEGFFADNLAFGSSTSEDSATITYDCIAEHDLWLGTSLYKDRGSANLTLDGVALDQFSAHLDAEPSIQTRRRIASRVAPGKHTVTIRPLGTGPFYLDYIEAAVAGDVPDPLPARPQLTAALDYSTDHTYKLPPQRIIWNLRQMGLTGPLNQYLGVFWWNQRIEVGGSKAQATVTFGGACKPGDKLFVKIGDTVCGKSVFPNETNPIFARHFAFLVNETFVGVWAETNDNQLILHARSAAPDYQYDLQVWIEPAVGSAGTGTVQKSGSLLNGVRGSWLIDPTQTPVLNRGARDWHTDFYQECSRAGLSVTTAVSMELVNPPDEFAARFPDGSPVITDTGFGGLHSTHCAFSAPTSAYQQNVFLELAGLMAGAHLTPSLQMGEFTWWYFTNFSPANLAGGMAYFDAATAASAQSSLGRPLAPFTSPDDNPGVNGGADALFLRDRLRDYATTLAASVRSAYPAATLEFLFPYDVNHPSPAGPYQLGGRLNRFVNLPLEWESKDTSPFDYLKIEALNFGAWSRDFDLARGSLDFAAGLNWPRQSLRAMVPIFRGGYPWSREMGYALRLGFGSVSLWAFDHLCLYGVRLDVPLGGRALFQGR